MTFIDYNHPIRRNYNLIDRDKLDVLGDIGTNIECLNDSLNYSVEPKLERIAAALEKLAAIEPAADTPTDKDERADVPALTEHPAADTDAPSAGWTITDNDGVTVCAGVTTNTGAFVFSALTEYAKRNAPELTFTYKDNG